MRFPVIPCPLLFDFTLYRDFPPHPGQVPEPLVIVHQARQMEDNTANV